MLFILCEFSTFFFPAGVWENNIFQKSKDHALKLWTLQKEKQFIFLQNVKNHRTLYTHLIELKEK